MEIVSISTHMPYDGIPHAGGDLYARHVRLLSESHRLTVVCPWTSTNEEALGRPVHGSYRRVLVVPPSRRREARRAGRRSLLTRALPFLTRGPFVRALLRDEELVATLRRAGQVELQWFDVITLAPRLRRALPGTPLTGVFHDVASQGHLRMLTSPATPWARRALALVRLVLSVPLEWRAVRALRTAVVLSDKDGRLLARRGAGDRVVVLPPALDDPEMPASPREREPATQEVLFVGAMWRPENLDAAWWLLREVWPLVRAQVPGARLTIAGAGSPPALHQEAAATGVEVTGPVESLSAYYRRASVAVSPMRLGAGVKLKGVVAMLWGVPVVATSVGAEGIEGPDVFAAVADDAAAFAAAVARVLTDPRPALEVAARAHAWSHARYSSAGHRQVLRTLYG
ncbi:glycosyltransferase [Geodermatophilus sp. SYSU D00684]